MSSEELRLNYLLVAQREEMARLEERERELVKMWYDLWDAVDNLTPQGVYDYLVLQGKDFLTSKHYEHEKTT